MHYIFKYLILLAITFTLSFTESYAINPQRQYAAKPDAVGLTYQTYKIKVEKDIYVNSWICLQKDLHKPYIIISGSDAGNMANSLGQAKAFYDEGYNVVLFDYRGFGESSDYELDRNMLYYNEFSTDLEHTIGFVEAKFKPSTIVLYGQSMGTIVSRMNLGTSKSVKALILDSFVIDPKLVADRVSAAKNKQILLPAKASEYTLSNKSTLDKPVLIFSGTQDVFTRTTDYTEFMSKNSRSTIIKADCNHLQCFTSMGTDPNLYMVEARKFIAYYNR